MAPRSVAHQEGHRQVAGPRAAACLGEVKVGGKCSWPPCRLHRDVCVDDFTFRQPEVQRNISRRHEDWVGLLHDLLKLRNRTLNALFQAHVLREGNLPQSLQMKLGGAVFAGSSLSKISPRKRCRKASLQCSPVSPARATLNQSTCSHEPQSCLAPRTCMPSSRI